MNAIYDKQEARLSAEYGAIAEPWKGGYGLRDITNTRYVAWFPDLSELLEFAPKAKVLAKSQFSKIYDEKPND